jgi:hypothetical protein
LDRSPADWAVSLFINSLSEFSQQFVGFLNKRFYFTKTFAVNVKIFAYQKCAS